MKKFIVMGIVLTMILACGAAYADATNWTVFSIVGAGTGSTVTAYGSQNYYGVTTSASDDLAGEDSNGSSIVNTSGYIRDYGLGNTAGGYGLIGDIKEAFTTGSKTWSNITVGTGGSFTSSSLRLRFWQSGLDSTCPKISVKVTKGFAGTAFATGTVLIPTWDVAKVGSKSAPAYWFDLTPLIPTFNTKVNNVLPTMELEMTASYVPEPGSMVAMLSGLVGLVGFGIRRRK